MGERSVEVGGQASLLLDRGGVVCRHAAIGTGGTGEVAVEGTGGYFEATGRLGVGTEAQGSAVVEGTGASWTTGNIAVGLEDDGALLVEVGAQVTSDTGVLGFNLDGEDRGRAAVRGADGAGTPSRWQLTSLAVRARGGLVVSDGGEVVAESLRIGAEGGEETAYATDAEDPAEAEPQRPDRARLRAEQDRQEHLVLAGRRRAVPGDRGRPQQPRCLPGADRHVGRVARLVQGDRRRQARLRDSHHRHRRQRLPDVRRAAREAKVRYRS